MQDLTRVGLASCGFLAVVALGACSDQPPTAPIDVAAAGSTSAAQLASRGDSLAYALGTALGDGALRGQMLQAMRASPMNEHKLVLQDFVATYAARGIVAAAASKLRVSPDRFQRLVADLPRLDLYLPFTQHRLTWEGTPDVVVAVVYDENAPTINAVGVDGSVTTLRRDAGVPAVPLLIMHPEEPKLRRDNPQTDVRGTVVQEPTDGTSASAHMAPGVARNGVTAWLSGNRPASAPATASQSSLISGVYINHFNVQEGDGWFGNSEMQFHSVAVDGPIYDWVGDYDQMPVVDATCDLGSYYQNNVEEDRGYDGLFSLSPGVTNVLSVACNGTLGWYAVAIVEDDGLGTGGNDDFGWRFWYSGTYPFGATVGTATGNVQSFYTNTWDPTRSAYFRIQYN
jgi:hypothetical protein